MFLINQLNRRITDQYYPVFECFYSIEVFLVVLQLLTSIQLTKAIWRTAQELITVPLIACTLIRKATFAFFGSLPFYIAMDRFIASRCWNWYNKGGIMTTILFALKEIIHFSLSLLFACLLVNDYVNDQFYMMACGVFLVIGFTFYFYVYRADKREMMSILKRGPTIDSYSVNRSYQLKENINLMNMFSRMMRPIGIFIPPQIIAYALISIVPSGKYDYVRHFAIGFFNIWIIVNGIVSFVAIPFSQPQIARHMHSGLQFFFSVENNFMYYMYFIERKGTTTDTNTYFDQLSLQWQGNNRVKPFDP